MSLSLYRKYRPSTWTDVVGQAHVVDTLRNAVAAGRVGHAYLFAGPRGTGKTSVARLLAKAINCENADPAKRPDDSCEICLSIQNGSFLDLIEIDAASNTSVDDVRDLRDKINFSPNRGRAKVYLIDEVHMLSTAAFNALLKTLEEPPPHAIFILATTEMSKIPATVLSRCQRHEFRRLPLSETLAQLEKICKEEKIKAEKPALELIARQSTGSLRDAISLLDQLASSDKTLELGWAQQVLGTLAGHAILDLIAAIVAKNSGAGLDSIHAALDAGADARQFARQMVDTLRGVLLVRMGAPLGPEFAEEERQRIDEFAKALTVPQLLHILRLFNDAAGETKTAWQPGLPVEMAFVEAIQEPLQVADSPPPATPAPKSVNPPQARPPQGAVATKTAVNSPSQSNESTAFTNQEWTQLKEKFKSSNPNLLGLLNSVKMRELRGNVLFLGFGGDVLKEKMEKAENMNLVQGAINEVLGHSLEVRCFIANKPGELPAGLDSSGMVAAAVRLGGEIVDKSDLGKGTSR